MKINSNNPTHMETTVKKTLKKNCKENYFIFIYCKIRIDNTARGISEINTKNYTGTSLTKLLTDQQVRPNEETRWT
jgi:hypothetical protein